MRRAEKLQAHREREWSASPTRKGKKSNAKKSKAFQDCWCYWETPKNGSSNSPEEKLFSARVLVEVMLDQEYPEEIKIQNY